MTPAGLTAHDLARRSVRSALALLALAPLWGGACDGGGPTEPDPDPGPPAVARLELDRARVDFTALGDTARLIAQASDSAGAPLGDAEVEWTTLDATIADVDADGRVTSRAVGLGRIIASAGAHADTALVHVTQRVTSVVLDADSLTLMIGDTSTVTARALDANGHVVPDASFAWTIDEPDVARVMRSTPERAARGGIVAAGAGETLIRVTSGGTATAFEMRLRVTGESVLFTSVDVGGFQACGLDEHGAAFCWGGRYIGRFPVIGGYGATTFVAPVRTPGGHAFDAMGTGHGHACGLAGTNVWCWGGGSLGELGSGSDLSTPDPVAVAGGHAFVSLAVGLYHNCALDASGVAWCWGSNIHGQIGDGTLEDRFAPVPVGGDVRFSALYAGPYHTCGMSTDGEPWCWGLNDDGQLGSTVGDQDCWTSIGVNTCSVVPVPVGTGGLTFASLAIGGMHTCGLEADGSAWCWGQNDLGQLGGGSAGAGSIDPLPVTGGHAFVSLTSSMTFSCGLTADGRAWCWGLNNYGQVGTSASQTCHTSWMTADPCVPAPSVVEGGIIFQAIDAGNYSACGRAPSGVPYCWGENGHGQLGHGVGSPAASVVPLPVWGAL